MTCSVTQSQNGGSTISSQYCCLRSTWHITFQAHTNSQTLACMEFDHVLILLCKSCSCCLGAFFLVWQEVGQQSGEVRARARAKIHMHVHYLHRKYVLLTTMSMHAHTQSGLQFATSCIVKHKLLETFHTDLLFTVFVLHKWQELCKEDLMYLEQDTVAVMK